MRCDGCDLSATMLKTVVCRSDRERRGALCDGCWLPLADRLWIVPGPGKCFGTCVLCGHWVSVRDLRDAKLGGKRSAWVGTCFSCAES